ncbi:MAG: UDP-N-acetylmuramoyl-tripeptide--D-alanyl-D-alanine ligase [Thermodesulfobacteria bacterium]|nr:UDP-N-acetylmuramoyl-tripeptide--D-alanyl-D-alanine ligase [Thermodesulfobacteriota bacterium]
MITTEQVVRATGGILLNGDMNIPFSGVSHDSRTIKPGELFVAIRGPRYDGHRFVLDAFSRGAKGALVEYWPEDINIFELHRALSIIKVPDTRRALEDLAAYWRKQLGAKVVAVTGSCGKSTTKEMIASLLAPHFRVAKSPGNWNNLIGVPLSILNTPPETEVLVLELATNRPGEIARLTEIASPDVAVLVSVHPSHLEGLGDFEGVLKEKLALFEKAPSNAVLVYPYDQEEVRNRARDICQNRVAWCLSFGLGEGANVRAKDLEFSKEGTAFRLVFRDREAPVRLPLLGEHFVRDALAAAAAALALGLSFEEVARGLSQVETLSRRLEMRSLGPHLLLDDTYNANPASLEAACQVASKLKDGFSKAIAVVGDMKELGEASKELHEEAGRKLAQVFDRVFAVGEEAAALASAAGSKARHFQSKEELLEALKGELEEPSLVLVKGSRAMKMEEIVSALEEAYG